MGVKNFPPDFLRMLLGHYGEAETAALVEALTEEAPGVSIRLNPLRAVDMSGDGVAERVPWCPLGRLLPTRPRFILDPLLHMGAYYVQEAASMFLWHALTVALEGMSPARVLDLCASPGGKSTLARSLLPDDCTLVANEVVPARTAALVENLSKWGHEGVIITSASAEAFAKCGPVFDVVICDVPCSGEGMFRKSEEAVEQWSMEKVLRCQRLQREIVRSAWQALKPGGRLIYSTCTFNPYEDEDNVDWICSELGGETIDLQPSPDWHILPAQHACQHSYHFLPHRTPGEGFFLSAIWKRDANLVGTVLDPRAPHTRACRERDARSDNPYPAVTSEWVMPEADIYVDYRHRPCVFALQHRPLLSFIFKKGVKVLQAGLPFAELRGGNKWVPLQPLALSRHLDKEAFPQVELSVEEALNYLRGNSLILPASTPRGYTLLTYQHQPLGFANNIGARANNLYPNQWRIRN